MTIQNVFLFRYISHGGRNTVRSLFYALSSAAIGMSAITCETLVILYFIPYYSRYIHGEHVAIGGRASAYRCGIYTIVYRVVGTAAVFDGHLDPVV